jgi:molecular chaperone DnaK
LLEKELGLAEVSMVNPDEIVALGAGVQAGLLAESIAGEGVRDVTGFSLGVEVATGEFVTMLPKNSEIPSTTRRTFTTVADNQESVEIHVLQGESSAGGDRLSLGRFLLSGIRQGKRGQAQIEVTFGLDVDGIASVTARDADTGAEQEVTVTPVVDAEAFGNDPARDSRARLRSLLARTETLLGQCEQIVDEEFQRDISSIVSSARKALQSGRKNKLRESETALEAIIGELNAYLRRMETEHAGA